MQLFWYIIVFVMLSCFLHLCKRRCLPSVPATFSQISFMEELILGFSFKTCYCTYMLVQFCYSISDDVWSYASLCSGAEYLLEVVHGTIPLAYFEPISSVTASEVAVHILDSLYKRLDEACLVQGGEVLLFIEICSL